MKKDNRLICDCCARQIVSGSGKPNNLVTFGPVTLLGNNLHACYSCSSDLDENGLFPEERF